jgi:hypothetical protein
MRERAEHFHDSSIAAKREDGAVLVRVRPGQSRGVSRSFSRHHVTFDAGALERFDRLVLKTSCPARRRIDDEEHTLDAARREFHRGRGAQN